MRTVEKLKMHSKEKTKDLVIGLDSSTTSTKALAFNKKGSIIAYANETIPLSSPQPNYYEQDPRDWWISAQKALRKIMRQIEEFLGLLRQHIEEKATLYDGINAHNTTERAFILAAEELGEIADAIIRGRKHSIYYESIDLAHCAFLIWATIEKDTKNAL